MCVPLGTHPVYEVRSRANHLPITGGNIKPIQLLVVLVLGPRADVGPKLESLATVQADVNG